MQSYELKKLFIYIFHFTLLVPSKLLEEKQLYEFPCTFTYLDFALVLCSFQGIV